MLFPVPIHLAIFLLDPFNEHTDERLWSALEKVGLASIVREMDGALEVCYSSKIPLTSCLL